MFNFLRYCLRNLKKVWILVLFLLSFFVTLNFVFEYTKNFESADRQKFYISPEIYNELIPKTPKYREEKMGLVIPPFPIDAECLRTAGEENFAIKEEEEDFDFLKTEEGKSYKKILFYFHKYAVNNKYGSGHKLFARSCCREKRCFLTDKRGRIPFKDFDSILIQHSHFNPKTLPKVRAKHQRWIMIDMEPPSYYSTGLEKYPNIFNWTMTHRRDSDIWTRYGYVYPKKNLPVKNFYQMENFYPDVESVIKKKTKLVVWMVSHCETVGGRESFVDELKQYVDLDIYGKCGSMHCGDKDHPGDPALSGKCYKEFEKDYKFYLSFENSICTDYITEKFFNILRYYMVPVVLGAGDYSSVSPPHSYINARNFFNAKALAQYLLYLDSNDTAYKEYFKWKKDYITVDGRFAKHMNLCNLCEKLHNDQVEKVYSDMKDWFLTKSNCLFCGAVPGRLLNVTKCFNNSYDYRKALNLDSLH